MYDLRYVSQLDCNITDLCDKTCSFCPRHDPDIYPNNNKHMSVDLFKKIIDECLEVGYSKDILLCGRGEPSLNKYYEDILELLHHPKRTWRTALTTNGRKIEKYWDFYTNNFDFITLNTYTNQKEYDERVKKYGWKLNTTGKHGNTPRTVYNLDHYFKPDGATVEEANEGKKGFQKGFEIKSSPGVTWRHNFNKRCGLQGDIKQNPAIKKSCAHAMEFIFLNFDGKIHMCCNDWGSGNGKGQTIVGDFSKNNLFDEYRRNKKRAMINHNLINGRRYMIDACSKCEIIQKGDIRRMEKAKKDAHLMNYLGKILMTKDNEMYVNDKNLQRIERE